MMDIDSIKTRALHIKNQLLIPMTPTLPLVGYPLAGGGMSSASAADFLYVALSS